MAIFLTILAFSSAFASPVKQLAGKRPNIILVLTDDQGMGDFSCMGNPVLKTPQMDSLRRESVYFSDFQVSPTCAPTRSAIMSGRHEFKNGVTHTILERERMALGIVTLPQILANAGYSTGIFGKWHLGDEPAYQPGQRGFQEVFIHGAGGIGQKYPGSCADCPANRENKYFDVTFRHNGQFVKTRGFCTDVIFSASLDWIAKQKDSGAPFFAYIATNAPHSPMLAPEKYKKRFLEMGFDQSLAARYGMIENIDDNLKRLTDCLKKWNLEENTLLIFMTDNGQDLSRFTRNGKPYRQWTAGYKTGKGSPYEGGTHVPAFWRWKGTLPSNAEIKTLSAAIDILPTLAELGAAEYPESIQKLDGRSLVPILENPAAPQPERYLFTHVGRWEKGAEPENFKYNRCAVRCTRFRLVNNTELYDIQNDPYERHNVINQFAEQVKIMRNQYDTWFDGLNGYLVNENAAAPSRASYEEAYEKQKSEEGVPEWTPTLSVIHAQSAAVKGKAD